MCALLHMKPHVNIKFKKRQAYAGIRMYRLKKIMSDNHDQFTVLCFYYFHYEAGTYWVTVHNSPSRLPFHFHARYVNILKRQTLCQTLRSLPANP